MWIQLNSYPPGWLRPLAAVTPEPWPLACRRLQQLSHKEYHQAIFSKSMLAKYPFMRVNKTERKTQHPCNRAPPRRWVTHLREQSGRAFTFTSSKKRQHTVSNNCCNPEIVRGGGRKLTHETFVPFGPDAFTSHSSASLTGSLACTHNLCRSLYTCRSVQKIRGDSRQNPVVHLSGGLHLPPLPAVQELWGGAQLEQRARHQRSCLKPPNSPEKNRVTGGEQ